MAAERLTEPAIGATRPSIVGLREDRPRRGERVKPELARGLVKDDAGLIEPQRWQRIVAPPRRFEHIAAIDLAALHVAALAGDPELVFGPIVIGLELRIAQRPVGEGGILRNRSGAVALDGVRARLEIVLVQAPRHRPVMDRAAARLVAVVEHWHRRGARIDIRAPSDRLTLDVRP